MKQVRDHSISSLCYWIAFPELFGEGGEGSILKVIVLKIATWNCLVKQLRALYGTFEVFPVPFIATLESFGDAVVG